MREGDVTMIDFKTMEDKLKNYGRILDKIKDLNKEMNEDLECMKEQENILRANIITDMPHGTDICNPTLQAVERLIDRYQKSIESKANRISELMDERELIEILINELTTEESDVIRWRYFNKCSWRRVALAVNYSKRQCENLKDSAINELVKEYNKRQKSTA